MFTRISGSWCRCGGGHAGPACNDPSGAESDYSQLTRSLVVTITSLALLPATMLALYRQHYTECGVYWLQLVSSCLHHACRQQVTLYRL